MQGPKTTIYKLAPRKSIEELFIEAEIDSNDPFQMRCWEQVKRVYNDMPPPTAVPLKLVAQSVRCVTLYKELQENPTEETLEALTVALDSFLPAFEKAFGSKWGS